MDGSFTMRGGIQLNLPRESRRLAKNSFNSSAGKLPCMAMIS
jgi:hypothetical protein